MAIVAASMSSTAYIPENIFSGAENKAGSELAWTGSSKVDPWIELDLGETNQVRGEGGGGGDLATVMSHSSPGIHTLWGSPRSAGL